MKCERKPWPALVSLGYDGVTAGRAVAAASDCERLEDMISEALRAIPSGFRRRL